MSAFDLPAALETVEAQLAREGDRPPLPDAVRRALDALSGGASYPAQPPLHQLVSRWPPLTWLRLNEVATDSQRQLVVAKLVGALTRLHASLGPVLVSIGGSGAGQVGLAVGIADVHAVAGWTAGLATELIFNRRTDDGWHQRDAAFEECALIGLPTTASAPAPPDRDPAPTLLELLLGAGTAWGPWSVDLVLRPLETRSSEILRRRSLAALLRAQQSVSLSSTLSESVTRSFDDAAAERLVEILRQWQSLAHDCLRVGAWTVAVRVRASSPADLAAAVATFSAAHGDDVFISDPARRQVWVPTSVQPNADESATWLSSRDVSDLMVPSGPSVGDVSMRRALASGRQLVHAQAPLDLGHWLGSSVPAALDLDDLGAHVFIGGITGSGKSTTTRRLLSEVANRHHVPFLVIDPAKTDYETFGRYLTSGLRVVQGRDLRMNVLRAWPGCDTAQHIARVSNAFRGSFGMPSPVPYVASILFDELAAEAQHGEVTLHDAQARLDSLIAELAYRGEIEDNIKASLGLRLRLLLQPARAERVASLGVAPDWLTERPTVVQLGDVADDEERNFLASMLVLYVSDAARRRGLRPGPEHITVIEEAHRLMPEPRTSNREEGDAGAVSAKLMAQLLAEVRAYGESLIVIDQSPAAVSREVLRNTNVKLVHRTVDRDDQRALGGALGLDDEESSMLGSLSVGRMLVSTRNLVRPQTAVVAAPLAGVHSKDPPAPAAQDGYLCHGPGRHEPHHRAERWGTEMERLIAAWSLGAEEDPRERASGFARLHGGVPAACLLHVGLSRHVRTLRTVGYLDASRAAAFGDLWSALVEGRMPAVPRASAKPLPLCALCPEPCTARALVESGTLASVRRARRDLDRAGDSARIVERVLAVDNDLVGELSRHRRLPVVVACVRAHLAEEFGVSHLLLDELG